MFENASDSIYKITANLRRRVKDLEEVRQRAPTAAFVEVLETEYENYMDILEAEINTALDAAPEFGYTEFRNALLKVLNLPVIEFEPLKGEKIAVKVNMKTYAGDLDDYAKGIKFARKVVVTGKKKFDPLKASKYWKEVIYARKVDLYDYTIQLRFEAFKTLAPFWSLLNDGVPQEMTSDRGGIAYPTNEPTRFKEITERVVSPLATDAWKKSRDTIIKVANAQIAEVSGELKSVNDAVLGIQLEPEKYKTPGIVRQVSIIGQRYFVYITDEGNIGLAKRPRRKGGKYFSIL